ncbi:MAG: Membrane protein insertase YidC, partial [Bacteroidota bacterium]|nr:Membrane protein insertase YidC [Bacteroidota bacterium]
MDKNTITGIILIFAIFVGASIYNSNRLNKGFENAVKAAETEMVNGNLERARTEYVNALRFKPNQPEVLLKLSELNIKLGITADNQVADTVSLKTENENPIPAVPASSSGDPGQYGVFAKAAEGENGFITLENNKIELKISLLGGRVYSARMKEFRTYDSLPLILFSGDSTIFGFNFFTADNKAVQTNNLYFTPLSEEKSLDASVESKTLIMRLYADEEKYIEYKYTLAPDKYSLDYNVTFKNMVGILPPNQNSISLDWRMYIPQQEKGRQNEDSYTTIKFKYYQDDVDGLKLR